jgi:hypothetical protein
MELNQVTCDSQSEAEAALLTRYGRIGLPKTVEDVWKKLGIYSLTFIRNGYFDV